MTPIFDSLAENYDTEFSQTTIGQSLRQRVQQNLLKHWQTGDSILELGCGTGEDAIFFAQKGIQVTATDASSKMLAIASQKGNQHPNLTFRHLDLQRLPRNELNEQFDGVYSNFGVLNCLQEWRPLSEWLASRIKVGSIVGFGIMSPYCLWEIIWHSLHFDFRTAFVVYGQQPNSRKISNQFLLLIPPSVI